MAQERNDAHSNLLDELAAAERNLRDGEARVVDQRRRLDRLRQGGHSTEMAEILLAQFETSLTGQRAHLDLLRRECEEAAAQALKPLQRERVADRCSAKRTATPAVDLRKLFP